MLIQQRMDSSWIDPLTTITPAIIQANLEWMRDLSRLAPKPENFLEEWMRVDDAFGSDIAHTAKLLLPLMQRAQDLINGRVASRRPPGGRRPVVALHEAPMLDAVETSRAAIFPQEHCRRRRLRCALEIRTFTTSTWHARRSGPNYVSKEFENLITEWGDNPLGPQLIGGGTRLGKSAAIMLLVTLMARFKDPGTGKALMAIAVGFGPDKNIAMTDWKKRIERLPWARFAAEPRFRVLAARWTDPGRIPSKMKFRRFADAHSAEAKADRREQRAAHKREVQSRGVPEDENVSSPTRRLACGHRLHGGVDRTKMEQGKVLPPRKTKPTRSSKRRRPSSRLSAPASPPSDASTTAIKPRDAEDPRAATIGYR